MKIHLTWDGDLLLLRFRVYHRANIRAIPYMARITGPHPNYLLARSFVDRSLKTNSRWDSIVCYVDHEGIYEIVIKRLLENGIYLSRERRWLVVADGQAYLYEDEELNAQYVLYCAWLLGGCKGMAA
jgi:hypothetical protein